MLVNKVLVVQVVSVLCDPSLVLLHVHSIIMVHNLIASNNCVSHRFVLHSVYLELISIVLLFSVANDTESNSL